MKNNTGILRLFDLVSYSSSRYAQKTAFCTRDGEKWSKTTFEEYQKKVNLVSYGLATLGIKKGDKIITISRNRAEFNFVDMGIMQTGAIHVPLYANIDDLKLQAILVETGCKIVFTGSAQIYRKVLLLKDQAISPDQLFCFDVIEGAATLDALLKLGSENQNEIVLQTLKAGILSEDIASITYISGSTTEVKGIEHTHSDHIHNSLAIAESTCILNGMNLLSLLPLAHSYERSINYCSQYLGVTTWYNNNFKTIGQELQEIKPDVIFVVPFLLQKLYNLLIAKIQQECGMPAPDFLKGIEYAMTHEKQEGIQYADSEQKQLFTNISLSANKLMGGNIKMLYCGGASLDQNLRRFFDNCGMTCYEGYGLTEAGPVVTHNSPVFRKAGTVGRPIAETTIRIGADGEVLVKSPSAMKRYYNHPDSENPVDKDGWLHTGDIGELDNDGYLRLTGVKKRIFKQSSGIYTDPLTLEKLLETLPLIMKSLVIGHNRDYLAALIIPDINLISEKLSVTDPIMESGGKIYRQEELTVLFASEIKTINDQNKTLDSVLRFVLVDDEWTIQNQGLNINSELNRRLLIEKYQIIINQLY